MAKNWEPTDKYCPECGARTVEVETSDGDYYVGPDFRCMTCHKRGNLWSGSKYPRVAKRG
jgi:uncharacterized protein with PIN domain